MSHPPVSRLLELLSYDPQSGEMRWVVTRNNNAKAGSIAGSKSGNYWYVCVEGKNIPAHRVAWAMHFGQWPAQHIDHIDGNPANNKIENLRDVSRSENLRNQRRPHNGSATGILGVYKYRKKFRAAITVDGRMISLGVYSDPEEARIAYVAAKAELHGVNL